MHTKDFKFELKGLSEDGTFEGYLSVFDVVDLGGDLVEKGAFKKTIQEAPGGFVPMLWQHDEKSPIGKMFMEEDDYGLKVRGELILDVARAKEAYALLKANVINGLSIGYKAIRKEMENGIRHLKEIKLYEGSVVTFPMLPLAQVTSVKTDTKATDFITELQQAQLYSMRGLIMRSICYTLDDILYDYEPESDAQTKLSQSEEAIDQFKLAYMQHMPALLDLWGVKATDLAEDKAGRRISATTRTQIEEAITKLQALLIEDAATSDPESDAGKSIETAPLEQYSTTPDIPDDHLLLAPFNRFQLMKAS